MSTDINTTAYIVVKSHSAIVPYVFFIIAVSCSVPDVDDATKDTVGTIVYPNAVTYVCSEGYIKTSGNLMRTCLATSQLSGQLPVCTRGM